MYVYIFLYVCNYFVIILQFTSLVLAEVYQQFYHMHIPHLKTILLVTNT